METSEKQSYYTQWRRGNLEPWNGESSNLEGSQLIRPDTQWKQVKNSHITHNGEGEIYNFEIEKVQTLKVHS
jgi:hypothetical protein